MFQTEAVQLSGTLRWNVHQPCTDLFTFWKWQNKNILAVFLRSPDLIHNSKHKEKLSSSHWPQYKLYPCN